MPDNFKAIAILGLVLSSLEIPRSGYMIYRLIRELKTSSTEEGSNSTRQHKDGSEARRSRRILLLCLFIADLIIGVSVIGPTALHVADGKDNERLCEASGFLLSSGLWWQYGFTLCIAISTLINLRFPLSRLKDTIEKRGKEIIVLVLVLGGLQAGLWKTNQSYVPWHGLCLYGDPSHTGNLLMQLLPRLLTSLAIISIYTPLIIFLRRPDPGALYLQSPQPASPFSSTSEDNNPLDTTPPWERLSFPNFQFNESDVYGFSPRRESVVSEYRIPDDKDLRNSGGLTIDGLVGLGVGRPSLTLTMATTSTVRPSEESDRTLTPSHSAASTIKKISEESTQDLPPRSPHARFDDSIEAVSRIEPSLPPQQSLEISFEKMLTYVPSNPSGLIPAEQHIGRSRSSSKSSVPKVRRSRSNTLTERTESRAESMNRRTGNLLVCFPISHVLISALTLSAILYTTLDGSEDIATGVLIISSCMLQSIFDFAIFGIIEPRMAKALQIEDMVS